MWAEEKKPTSNQWVVVSVLGYCNVAISSLCRILVTSSLPDVFWMRLGLFADDSSFFCVYVAQLRRSHQQHLCSLMEIHCRNLYCRCKTRTYLEPISNCMQKTGEGVYCGRAGSRQQIPCRTRRFSMQVLFYKGAIDETEQQSMAASVNFQLTLFIAGV